MVEIKGLKHAADICIDEAFCDLTRGAVPVSPFSS
jgi:hypothetical protein